MSCSLFTFVGYVVVLTLKLLHELALDLFYAFGIEFIFPFSVGKNKLKEENNVMLDPFE